MMSLIYRYTSIFPGVVQKIGTSKWMIGVSLLLQLILFIIICFITGEFFSFNHDVMVENAIKFSPVLAAFSNEPTLILIDREFIFPIAVGIFIILIAISLTFIIITINLLFELRRNVYTSQNFQLQKTLIISCVVQVGITLVFLFIPEILFFYYMSYGYAYGGPIVMADHYFISLHSVLEMIATVYFVLPYRIFLKNLFTKNSQIQAVFNCVPTFNSKVGSTVIHVVSKVI